MIRVGIILLGIVIIIIGVLIYRLNVLVILWPAIEQNQEIYLIKKKIFDNLKLILLICGGVVIFGGIYLKKFQTFIRNAIITLNALDNYKFLSILFSISLILRVLWVVLLPNDLVSDSIQYDRLARSLASGGGYTWGGQESAYWPPGFPLVLSVIYKLFGYGYFIPKLTNIFLSVGIIFISYRIVQIIFNDTIARLTAITLCFSPSQIADCSLLRTEISFAFLFLLGVFCLLKSNGKSYFGLDPYGIAAGLAIGYAALIKPILILFPLLVLIIFILKGENLIKLFGKTITVTLFMIITILPWTIRNYLVFRTFVPISTNGEHMLWVGNNPYATGTYLLKVNDKLMHHVEYHPLFLDKNLNEIEISRRYKSEAIKFIKNNPRIFLKRGLKKMFFFYSTDNDGINWTLEGLKSNFVYRRPLSAILLPLSQIYYGLTFLLLLIYPALIASQIEGNKLSWLPLIPILYFSAVYFIFIGDSRFHFAIIPYMVMCSSFIIYQFSGIANHSSTSSSIASRSR